jgi:CubicO group peptidase (beta-lactamase class C family)
VGTQSAALSGREGFTLEGWQTEPQLRWSFQHIADVFPTATIRRSSAPVALGRDDVDLQAVVVRNPTTGVSTTFGDVMASTVTDGWVVTRDGRIVQEAYPQGMPAETAHLLMSVSKSIIGVVAGVLADHEVLDPERLVTDYVPALADSGYAGATVRHLLDMRSGIKFSEEYLNPAAEVRLLEQAIGWAPRRSPDVPETLYGFLKSLVRQRAHGVAFEYRSCETDVLGWVCEQAGGARMPDLISDLVWEPIGAEFDANISVDREGSGMFDGGISAALRDLVRLGSIYLTDGVSFGGRRVVSPRWVEETVTGAPDSAGLFAAGDDAVWMPGGMYRNQMWFPTSRRDVLLALGIHGQMVYVNRTAGVVAAKLSSWPTPQDPAKLLGTIAAFDAVAESLAGTAPVASAG